MSDRLTPAQERARMWLPSDGAWRMNPGRLSSALTSLSFAWPRGVQSEWTDCGPRGGRVNRWRFTELGVELNKSCKTEGANV